MLKVRSCEHHLRGLSMKMMDSVNITGEAKDVKNGSSGFPSLLYCGREQRSTGTPIVSSETAETGEGRGHIPTPRSRPLLITTAHRDQSLMKQVSPTGHYGIHKDSTVSG
ncbi:uncharacterized [Tachysurus ichikawai]